MSEARRARGQQGSAGSIARSLLGRLDTTGGVERSRAVNAWLAVAGEEVARHAMGFAMRGSELLVYTDSPVWAGELAALSEHYRIEINKAVGRDLVSTLRFAASRKVVDERSWRKVDAAPEAADGRPKTPRVETVPATKEELAQVEAMTAGIHNPEVRTAAVRAAVRGLELRKGREAEAARRGAPKHDDHGSDKDTGNGSNH